MLKIDKDNKIELTRGDTAYLDINLTQSIKSGSEESYEIGEHDVIRFTARKNYVSEIALQKVLEGKSVIHILPEDTRALDFGDYVYDIEITLENGDVFTIVSSKLKLGNEVTY